ncbi:MAG: D-alanyl-D-alanine carboxypeptidase [Clostridia bacterium]|nr:D-alanyl-D-alanine carboxypeptidase [Clostridia bacterium]
MINKTKIAIIFLLIILCIPLNVYAMDVNSNELEINAKSVVLMDANTGTVLYEKNKDEKLPPASVTKIMTLLLVFEALDEGRIKLDDMVTVSENAASMGGSQIFLEPGEQMCVEDLIKSVVIASANDGAVALAEYVGGSEESFVYMMNKRARELGMTNTFFENATGLDDDTSLHLTTAYDIALMSQELLKHEKITDYTTIWMDTVRNGEFGLSNTNKLIRFYRGATGLKTGSTSKAGFCISATAKRDGLHLISVIMGSDTSQIRNATAVKLLDYGFARYEIYNNANTELDPVSVSNGKTDYVNVKHDGYDILIPKGKGSNIEKEIKLNENIKAPLKNGDVVGSIIYKLDGEIIGEDNIYCTESVEKIDFIWYISSVFKKFVLN